jgi:TolB-like protein/DNA-binding winged helix-turn-helix (wHTH) protein/tetratricopeptide (TPR) repeat protein
MDISVNNKGVYAFGPFRLDPLRRTLTRDDAPVKLAARLFDTLLYLVEAQGRLVEKDELLAAIWPGRIVEEGNLPQAISVLRKTLQTDGGEEGYIVTVAGRGYRFAAPVRREGGAPAMPAFSTPVPTESPALIPAPHTPTVASPPLFRRLLLPLVGVALVAGIGVAAWRALIPSPPSLPQFAPPPHSVAVLAFTNLSGDPANEYFSDGITEEIINTLARVPAIHVAARVSAFSFKGKPAAVADIAHALNVGTVLEGSVRRDANRLRIGVQLDDATTGFTLWSRSFDRDAHDLLTLEGEIATLVADALQVSMGQAETSHITMGGTSNPEAFDLYLHAIQLMRAMQDNSFSRVVALLDRAVQLDPSYARAYATRAVALANLALSAPAGTPSQTVQAWSDAALKSADTAIALAPDLAAAHGARGFILDNCMLRPTEAFREASRARDLEPNNAAAVANFAQIAMDVGHVREGLDAARQAAALDPLRPDVWYILGDVLYMARHYDEATLALQHEKTLRGTLPENSLEILARLQLHAGDAAGAEKTCQGVGPDWIDECFALADHALGKTDAAQAHLAHLHTQAGDGSAYSYAQIAAQWGDKDAALTWLETAQRRHDPVLAQVNADPLLDPISEEPRFREVVRQLQFPP